MDEHTCIVTTYREYDPNYLFYLHLFNQMTRTMSLLHCIWLLHIVYQASAQPQGLPYDQAFQAENNQVELELTQEQIVAEDMFSNHIRKETMAKEPVLFEPMDQIRMSKATYHVTSLFKLSPYLDSLNSLAVFVGQFLAQIADSRSRYREAVQFQDSHLWSKDHGQSNVERLRMLKSHQGQDNYFTTTDSTIDMLDMAEAQLNEMKVFLGEIHDKMVAAIDHIHSHPNTLHDPHDDTLYTDTKNNATRLKRNVAILQEKQQQLQNTNASDAKYAGQEAHFRQQLAIVKKQIRAHNQTLMNSKPKSTKTRAKRFLGALLLGIWTKHKFDVQEGMIRQLDDNVALLEQKTDNNRADILKNYHMINLTRQQTREHRLLLNVMKRVQVAMQRDLEFLGATLSLMYVSIHLLGNVQLRLTELIAQMDRYRFATRQVYDFLATIPTGMVTPELIPPPELRLILESVSGEITAHPRLLLPDDPEDKIWEYYKEMRMVTIVLPDYLAIVLQIPLVDASMMLRIFRVHNLPALHPQLQVHFQYDLETSFIGITKNQEYATLLTEMDVVTCLLSRGHWCTLNTALYPVNRVKWCVTSLFKNDKAEIEQNCRLKARPQTTNLAYRLQNNMWAVSALVAEKVQIRCLRTTHFVHLQSPFQLVPVPNACEVYSTNLYIPATTELSSKTNRHTLTGQTFLGLNVSYINYTDFRMMQTFNVTTLTEDEVTRLTAKLSDYDTLPMPTMTAEIGRIRRLKGLDKHRGWLFQVVSGSVAALALIAILITILVLCAKFGLIGKLSACCCKKASKVFGAKLSETAFQNFVDHSRAAAAATITTQLDPQPAQPDPPPPLHHSRPRHLSLDNTPLPTALPTAPPSEEHAVDRQLVPRASSSSEQERRDVKRILRKYHRKRQESQTFV